MKVILTKIDDSKDSPRVEFECDYGRGSAIWLSDQPLANSEYEVELDCSDSLKLGLNAFTTNDTRYAITSNGESTTFVASVEEVYDDGMVALRLGDAVVVSEFELESPEKGKWIKVTTNQLELNNVSP